MQKQRSSGWKDEAGKDEAGKDRLGHERKITSMKRRAERKAPHFITGDHRSPWREEFQKYDEKPRQMAKEYRAIRMDNGEDRLLIDI